MNYKTDSGPVIGNVEAKYETRNPIAGVLMNGFLSSFGGIVRGTGSSDIHEVGCGVDQGFGRVYGVKKISFRHCFFSSKS